MTLKLRAGLSILFTITSLSIYPTTANSAELVIAADRTSGYNRSLFKHWIDADRNGCNTRAEVLIEEAVVKPKVGSKCTLTGGKWFSAYDGVEVTSASKLDVDHMVPLAEAWRSGAWKWSAAQRQAYANDLDDARAILERASARETAARVALGAVARNFLEQSVGITILSHVLSIGSVRVADDAPLPLAGDMLAIDEDPVRCADKATSAQMITEIENAHRDGDTLGGVVEVLAFNMPPGLGSHVHWDRRLDAKLAGAVMGIQAIKGVEIGDGFRTATRRGSVAHDEIEKDATGKIVRRTDRAGGTEGGMSNGEILRVRAAMKPISTVPKALDTIDVATGEAAKAINQRSDVCAVPAAGVVAEAMVALVLAEVVLEKFGGDSVTETRRNYESYIAHLNFK